MRANRRFYRLLDSARVTATAGAAQRPRASALAATSSSSEDDVTHFTCEKGVGLLVELASVLSEPCLLHWCLWKP